MTELKHYGPFEIMAGAVAAKTSATVEAFKLPGIKTIQASISGSGSVAATVIVDVSNDNKDWILNLVTITLSGTTTDSDGAVIDAPWTYLRARLTAITGTKAAVSVSVASEG